MSEKRQTIVLQTGKSAKIIKWKVKTGMVVTVGSVILLYENHPSGGEAGQNKLKSTSVGTIRTLLAKEGDIIKPGEPLVEVERCTHPTIMKDMCAECGADLRNEEGEGSPTAGSIPMVHSIPELKVNEEQAQILGKADEERLLSQRKLVLLVDLDQTLIHTTNDNIPPNLKDVYHFYLHGGRSPWYHTRLRPGTEKFLEEMSKIYELHICTFGSRSYAHMIATFLDPAGKFFAHRILSRDECFSANCKTANLKALFPCGDSLVCIIDDREDVWSFVPNLIHVKPYHFFQHTGDINAPPGLAKKENDDDGDYDFNCLGDGQKVEKEGAATRSEEENKNESMEKNAEESHDDNQDRNSIEDSITGDEDSSDFNREKFSQALKIEQEPNTEKGALKIEQEPNTEKGALKIEQEPDTEKGALKIEQEPNTEKGALKIEQEPDTEKGALKIEQEPDTEKGALKIEQEPDTEKGALKIEQEQSKEEEALKMEQEQSKEEEALKMEQEQTKEEKALKIDQEQSKGEEALKMEQKQCKKEEAFQTDQKQSKEEDIADKTSEKPEKTSEQSSEETKKATKMVVENAGETSEAEKPAGAEKVEDIRKLEMASNGSRNENGPTSEENKSEIGQPIETITSVNSTRKEDDEIDVQDADDYLLYLEEILKSIHREFYVRKDAGDSPDLRYVVPEIKGRVLKDTSIVFSGLVPRHIQLERSRAYQVAVSLGAKVTQDLVKGTTTHLVAVRPGTAKVNSARRMRNIFVVTADWLWTCAERWERVDEKVFPLGKYRAGTRNPPAHCSPEHPPPETVIQPAVRTRSPSGRFMDTINPLLSFSSADIADMDQEVEDIFNESESDGDDAEGGGGDGGDGGAAAKERPGKPTRRRKRNPADLPADLDGVRTPKRPRPAELDAESESSSSSADSLSGEHPRGWRQHELRREARGPAGTGTEPDTEEDLEESPSSKFRRGEGLPSDLDLGEDDSASQGSDEPPDEVDDGDWNMMGAALEREFLS